MKKKQFAVLRKPKYQKAMIDKQKISGFDIKPKNKFHYQVEVNSMTVVNPAFIERLIQRKATRKLDTYFKYIVSLIDGEDEDASTSLLALDDLAHYRSIVEYKYRKYLDEKYTNLLLQKIDILENEIRSKIVYQVQNIPYDYSYEEEKGKSR